ncbi:MAG: InlB B-repeat-containing protein, partial [Paludibacteraceae bacterium]|nr:InlB B-repeat-containing protein [Paludibacteraceae bacterium]
MLLSDSIAGQKDGAVYNASTALGEGWYLPSMGQIQILRSELSRVLPALLAISKKEDDVQDFRERYYWTSSMSSEKSAWATVLFKNEGYSLDLQFNYINQIIPIKEVELNNLSTHNIGDVIDTGSGLGILFSINANNTGGTVLSMTELPRGTMFLRKKTYDVPVFPDVISSKGDDGTVTSWRMYLSKEVQQDGYAATKFLRESGLSPAAEDVDFDNGWYIPNITQLQQIFSNRTKINNALLLEGGTILTGYYYSCTFGDKYIPWVSSGDRINQSLNYDDDRVRCVKNVSFLGEEPQVKIEVNSSNPEIGETLGTGYYSTNEEVLISAYAVEKSYEFSHWSDGSTENPRMIIANEDIVLYANYKLATFKVNASSNNEDFGTVKVSGNCVWGTEVVLTPIAKDGYVFHSWEDGNSDLERRIVVDDNITVKAIFWPQISKNQVNVGDVLCTDGYVLTVDEFLNSDKKAMGVVYFVDVLNNKAYVCSLNQYSYAFSAWNYKFFDVEGLTNYSNPIEAITSVEGQKNGQVLLNNNINIINVARYEGGEWYIPSVGQMGLLFSNYPVVDESLKKINKKQATQSLNKSSYWTSTEKDTESVLIMTYSGMITSLKKNRLDCGYRSVCEIPFFADGNSVPKIGDLYTFEDGSKGVICYISSDRTSGWATALNDLPGVYPLATKYNLDGNGVFFGTVSMKDYMSYIVSDGYLKTQRYREKGTSPAANAVDFDNGWYIPSPYQMKTIYSERKYIENELQNNGGSWLNFNDSISYWTSSCDKFYVSLLVDGSLFKEDYDSYTNEYRIRPVRNIEFDHYNLIAKVNNSESGYVVGGGSYFPNKTATITAQPKEHCSFVEWSDGVVENPRSIVMNSDTTLTAIFVGYSVKVNLSSADDNLGSVSMEGISRYNEKITISANTLVEGCHFSGWSDGNKENPRVVTLKSDTTIVATFAMNMGKVGVLQAGDLFSYSPTFLTREEFLENPNGNTIGVVFWVDPNMNYALVAYISQKVFGKWGNIGDVEGIPNTELKDLIYDFNGQANTLVMKNDSLTNIDGGLVKKTNFGYIPSAGEMRLLYANLYEVVTSIKMLKDAFNYTHADNFDDAAYFTSSELDGNHAWKLYSDGIFMSPIDKTYAYPIREITKIGLSNFNYSLDTYKVGDVITFDDGSKGVIACAERDHTWVVALDDSSESYQLYTENSTNLQEIAYETTSWKAMAPVFEPSDGYSCSRLLLENDKSPAVASIDTENGWYLPTANQLNKIFAEKSYLEKPMVDNGGNWLSDVDYWTCTLVTGGKAMKMSNPMGSFSSDVITNSYAVRAVRDVAFYNVKLEVNDENAGTTQGAGIYVINSRKPVISAIPSEGYHFVGWSDGVNEVTRTIETTTDTTIVANFEINEYDIEVSSNDESMGSVSEGGKFTHGTEVTLMATPKEGHHFVSWNDGVTDATRTITAVSDSVFVATFEINSYTIEVLSENEELGNVTGGGTFDYGATVILTAIPEPHCDFVCWLDGNTENPRVFSANEDLVHTARFKKHLYKLSVSVNESLMGSVDGAGEYEYGTEISLVALANDGYAFSHWDSDMYDDFYEKDVVVVGDTSFVANFKVRKYVVTIISSSDEQITGGGEYNYNDEVCLTVNPRKGYEFAMWNDGNTENPRCFNITDDVTFFASYTQKGSSVSVISFGGGYVDGVGVYESGSVAVLTPVPMTGYHFSHWNDGNEENPRMLSVGDENILLQAYFEEDTYAIVVKTPDPTRGTCLGSGNYTYGEEITIKALPKNGYKFIRWNDDSQLSSRNITVSENKNFIAYFSKIEAIETNVTNNHPFSVSAQDTVLFSPGNLQYKPSTKEWRFALSQTDIIGYDNRKISPTSESWMDLFSLGTSGKQTGAVIYQPDYVSENDDDFIAESLTYENNADWGVNKISNGGNTEKVWRTLSKDEWNYLINNRNDNLYGYATIDNKYYGLILLPDDWKYTLPFNPGKDEYYDTNDLTIAQWNKLEAEGAVFLPTSGTRYGSSVYNLNNIGSYWTSTVTNYAGDFITPEGCYGNMFQFYNYIYTSMEHRSTGAAVRLVKDVNSNTKHTVNVTIDSQDRNPNIFEEDIPDGGSVEVVTGGDATNEGSTYESGAYEVGETITIYAYPKDGYLFYSWNDGNKDNPRTILVEEEMYLYAIFVVDESAINNGSNTGNTSNSTENNYDKDSIIEGLEEKIKDLEEKIDDLINKKEEAEANGESTKELEDKIKDLEDDIKELEDKKDEIQNKIDEIEDLKNEKVELEEKGESTEEIDNRLQETQQELESLVDETNTRLDEIDDEMSGINPDELNPDFSDNDDNFSHYDASKSVNIGDILLWGDKVIPASEYDIKIHTAKGIVYWVDPRTGMAFACSVNNDEFKTSWTRDIWLSDMKYIRSYYYSYDALADMEGSKNTWYMSGNCSTMGYLSSKTDYKWFLPSAGQLSMLKANSYEVQRALEFLDSKGKNVKLLNGNMYWTSTEKSKDYAYTISGNGELAGTYKPYYADFKLIYKFKVENDGYPYRVGDKIKNADGEEGVLCYISPDRKTGWMVAYNDLEGYYRYGYVDNNYVSKPTTDSWSDYARVFASQDGYDNTTTMRRSSVADDLVAHAVDYEKGWYVPTVGQMQMIYAERYLIEDALKSKGGSWLKTKGNEPVTYITSTAYEYSSPVVYTLPNGKIKEEMNYVNGLVRPVKNLIMDQIVSVEESVVESPEDVLVYGNDNSIVVERAEGKTIRVYTISGSLIYM